VCSHSDNVDVSFFFEDIVRKMQIEERPGTTRDGFSIIHAAGLSRQVVTGIIVCEAVANLDDVLQRVEIRLSPRHRDAAIEFL